MDPDIVLVFGVVCLVLSFPSLLSAYSESRPPRTAMVMIVAGGAALFYAVSTRPGGYAIDDIPAAFVRVVGMVVN